jgi:hypothetical protein
MGFGVSGVLVQSRPFNVACFNWRKRYWSWAFLPKSTLDYNSYPMVRWLTKSRLRTALALLFFVVVLSFALVLIAKALLTDGRFESLLEVVALTGMVAAGLLGTGLTLILAWRADRQMAKESAQLQQKIKELELWSNSNTPVSDVPQDPLVVSKKATARPSEM